MTEGQDRNAIKKALSQVPVSDGQGAMAWLIYHSEEPISIEPPHRVNFEGHYVQERLF